MPIADVNRYLSKTVPLLHLTRAQFILSSVAHGLQLEEISGRSFVAVKWPRLRHGSSKLFGWRGLAGKKKARKLGLKTTPTYEIGWQTAYYKTAALPLS